ncbi:homogentisate 1,2-dioxygenase [Sinorhizobium americanum]|uniref:Homogentisate 1,2-dioxygenase n=1 Tax=Sinorhizobium americanum TaxID=194963 RepID=A0A4R2B9K9_9HYPH|nr:homogentisate 1,2-dioxygenase [Sinorhizobium americanum]TCN23246.1 homogentisate 1,2-dioxygenase [Sinorhizobium americanum]
MLGKAEQRHGAVMGEEQSLIYMPGFGNDFETESLPGALPQGQNSPQKCSYGLYAEQLSGSPFTAPRGTNERSWLYRIRPSVRHTGRFAKIDYPHWKTAPHAAEHALALGQLRWDPLPAPTGQLNFLQGIRTMTTAGDVLTQVGMAAHAYVFNADMVDDYFFNADGELLIVPETGAIQVFTELGKMDVAPSEICLVPRGMMFKVTRIGEGEVWRGYICENYGAKFTLPDRGPIGANCLANPRDFKTPVAAYEDKETPCRVQVKWCGSFHVVEIGHSPLDVVAWHGNYAPYKYDLKTFSPVGAILFDHPDPSIFTVLTAPSGEEGTANVDFVLFPPRWLVAEHTFRPPWYHRNIMSEFMGLIYGRYDAKEEGFVPGGMSLHNMMLAHGPDASGFEKATNSELKPVKLDNTMAFMFETRFPQQLTRFAAELETLQDNYIDCWADLKKRFNGTPEGDWS